MKTKILLLAVAWLWTSQSFSQLCDAPSASTSFQINNISTIFQNRATLMDNSVQSIGFENSNFDLGVSALFASSIWMGAIDPGGDLLVSARTYDSDAGTPFIPGPYPNSGLPNPNLCAQYDRFFQVSRDQIERHRADYADNQILDDPISDILVWPGRGNPEFEDITGFPLPNDDGGLAPFHDQNNDGNYNPRDGDFPLPASVDKDKIPEKIAWCIFNDAGSDISLGIEIHMTIWGFFCEENDLLNNSLFTSHKFINRSGIDLNEMRIGLWHDFDLGCPTDDYVGCSPTRNAFYTYNGNANDLCSCGNFSSFCEDTPAMGIKFLNQKMDNYINFYAPNSNAPPATTDPAAPIEFYRYLNGRWRDNTPLTTGGDGYSLTGGLVTTFAFPDPPLDVNGWSMLSGFLPPRDQRAVASADLGTFAPGSIYNLDMAYTFNYEEDEDSYQQVEPLLTALDEVQRLYNDRFATGCTTVAPCMDDCVWPGDANNDGIANYADLLEIGLAYNKQGPARNTPLSWAPWSGEDWADEFIDGTNFKHADCDGNGIVEENDFRAVTEFYDGFTHSNYQSNPICNEGPNLFFEDFPSGGSIDTLAVGSGTFVVLFLDYSESLYGLSFEVAYDTQYIDRFRLMGNLANWTGPDSTNFISFSQDTEDDPNARSFKYANVRTDRNNAMIENGRFIIFSIGSKDSISMDMPNITQLKFKNVRAILNDGTEVAFGGQTTDLVFEGLTVTSTREASAALPVRIAPNPVRDRLQVELNGFAAEYIELTDIQGRQLQRLSTEQWERAAFDLSTYPAGLYLLKVVGEGVFGTYKVIKY